MRDSLQNARVTRTLISRDKDSTGVSLQNSNQPWRGASRQRQQQVERGHGRADILLTEPPASIPPRPMSLLTADSCVSERASVSLGSEPSLGFHGADLERYWQKVKKHELVFNAWQIVQLYSAYSFLY